MQAIPQERTGCVDDIRAGVTELITGIASLKAVPILDDTPLRILGLDSLDLLELVMQCERRFGISIPDHEITRFRNVQDIFATIIRRYDGKKMIK